MGADQKIAQARVDDSVGFVQHVREFRVVCDLPDHLHHKACRRRILRRSNEFGHHVEDRGQRVVGDSEALDKFARLRQVLFEDRPEQSAFVAEVVEDRAGADSGGLCDRGHGCGVEAAFGEQHRCGVEDCGAAPRLEFVVDRTCHVPSVYID